MPPWPEFPGDNGPTFRATTPADTHPTGAPMSDPYTPISCSAHDRMVALATLGEECELAIGDPGNPERIRGVIVDVYTSDGAEHLRLRGGETYRLDEIHEVNGEAVLPA